jgi:hypothetical protein
VVVIALYRHFDANGRLLYVGISATPLKRTDAHSRAADWFGSVARIAIEHHVTREDALSAEREAIIAERPLFNRTHNRPAHGKLPSIRNQPRNVFLKLRVSPEDKAQFVAMAQTLGRPLSDIIREGMAEFAGGKG